MFSEPETRTIEVAIYGEPGTGKKTLMSLLNRATFRRSRDGRVFSFDAALGDESTHVESTVVTADVSATHLLKSKTCNVAAKAASSSCIALTKADVVPRDYSTSHFQTLINTARAAYMTDLDAILVDSTSVDGARELMEYIVNAVAPAQESYNIEIAKTYRWARSMLLDCIAACFRLPSATNVPPAPDTDLAMIASDEDIQTLAQSPMATAWSKDLHRRVGNDENLPPVAVYRLTQSLVAKQPLPSERPSMEYVRQHTTIPVPRVYHPHLDWLVMDHVDGEMLYECWHKQTALMHFRIACTLRLYLKELRSLKGAKLGAIDSGRVSGILFQDYEFSPFDSISRFKRFCEYVSLVGWDMQTKLHRSRSLTAPSGPRLPADWTPIFTHGDLNPSNILLDKRGTLWLVDWAFAGFYPPWMDSLVMRHFDEDVLRDSVSASWVSYRHFIAGETSADDGRFWDCFYPAIHRFQDCWMY